jgi:hypothetical protein
LSATNEFETAIALTKSVFELLDCVEAQLRWMVTYATENKLPTERFMSLHHLLARQNVIMRDLQNLEHRMAVARELKIVSDEKYHSDNPTGSNQNLMNPLS